MADPLPSTRRAPQIGDEAIDIMTSGYRWELGPDRTIDWSVSNGALGETWADRQAIVTATAQALDAIARLVDVRFNYLGTFADPAAASAGGSEINVAPTRDRTVMNDLVLAQTHYPRASDGALAGDVLVNLNSAAADYASYAPGGQGFFMLLHELGHALGLKHPFESEAAFRLTLEDTRFATRDYDWFSMMSYTDTFQSNREKFDPAAPMPLDVAGLRNLYGPNRATGLGDTLYEPAANDVYQTLWDAAGADTLSFKGATVGWDINLVYERLSPLDPVWTGYARPLAERIAPGPHTLWWLVGEFETVIGSASSDRIVGGIGPNVIRGGGGGDLIDGFQDWDVAVYDGESTDFYWLQSGDGWTVYDLRVGAPEGVDGLSRIEALRFNDREVDLTPRLSPGLQAAFRNVLRADGYSPFNKALAAELIALPLQEAVSRLVQEADGTTSVLTLSSQFILGRLPTEAEMDEQVATNSPSGRGLNSDHYAELNLENRYIALAVDLAVKGAGAVGFEAEYGGGSLLETVRAAYLEIFGAPASETKAEAILNGRVDYFAAWGGDGPEGIGTKAAAVGFLLAEAAKADLGTLQTANIAYLTDLADGAAYGVDLVGSYGGTPYLG
jgi:serralysin